jgi:transcriptional regulator with XRE-family HTH domain
VREGVTPNVRVFRQKERPRRLPEKLREIRMRLGLSQGGMSRRLGGEDADRAYISKYERGILEPSLMILLEYARIISATGGGEYLEVLIDDALDLPEHLPTSPVKGRGVRRSE